MILDGRGRPDLEEVESIKQRIITLIEEMSVTHPQRLRQAYNERYRQDKKIGWMTVRKYLDQLKNEGKIIEQVITQGNKRTISVIKTNF